MRQIILILLLLFGSCEWIRNACTCNDEMKKIRSRYGEPDSKSTTKSETLGNSETWHFDRDESGISRSYIFMWDLPDDCNCHVTESTFTSKLAVPQVREWKSSEQKRDCLTCPRG